MTVSSTLGRASLTAAGLLVASTPTWAGSTERISVGAHGRQGNGDSSGPAVSAGGRYVAFQSAATNLVRGGTNGVQDVFVRDRKLGTTERSASGRAARRPTATATLRRSGPAAAFVAFGPIATGLVEGDPGGGVYLRDRRLGETERFDLGPGGVRESVDGFIISISANGRLVGFGSTATNLVAHDTNGKADAFVRDRKTGTTERVSLTSDGGQADGDSDGAVVSADGRTVAFESCDGRYLSSRATRTGWRTSSSASAERRRLPAGSGGA